MAGKCFHHDHPFFKNHPVTPEYHCLPATGVGPQNFCQETWIPRAALCYISPETVKDKQQIWMELETSKKLSERKWGMRASFHHLSHHLPAPPSPSHPNTNPWLRLSALCPPLFPLHTLLPLNRAVFPSPRVPPTSCLPSAFQPESLAQESNALCSSLSSIHLLTHVLCVALFSSLVLNQERSKAGSGPSSPNCAGMYNSKLCLIRCIGMCWGSYAKAPIRLCIEGECACCCWHCPAQAEYFEVCVVHVPLLRSLWCDELLAERISPWAVLYLLQNWAGQSL